MPWWISKFNGPHELYLLYQLDRNMKTLQISLFLLFIVMDPAWAGSFKCVDSAGNITYSQQPTPQGKCIYLKTSNAGKFSPASAERLKAAQNAIQQGAEQRKEQQKIQIEVSKNEQLRKDNCEAAKTNLRNFQVHRRFRDKEGNVKRMPDDEREAKIKQAKDHINSFCD